VVKWEEVETKVITWALLAFLAGVFTLHWKMVVLETKVDMIQETILDVWEAQ
jgi:hypothetical protein